MIQNAWPNVRLGLFEYSEFLMNAASIVKYKLRNDENDPSGAIK
ncbi:MAG: hypothetical protein P8I94_01445 [Emcibacteraceae bacterium]|nr:hypothetical protein [Emcibacteraceae bacterium]